jgi:hypothetical protein
VRGSGGGVGVAAATKNMQMRVIRWNAEEQLIWGEIIAGVTRLMIEQVSHSGKYVGPEGEWCTDVQQHRAQVIIESAKNMLSPGFLLQRIGGKSDARPCRERPEMNIRLSPIAKAILLMQKYICVTSIVYT